MKRTELKDFYNEGFGWVCRHCERDLKENAADETGARSRLLSEGEAESKNPRLSNQALARWMDAAERVLVCPRCGITERAEPF
jgi:rubrerythrin